MERQEFLRKLRHSLRWTFTHEEVTDILADYDGFFVSGDKEGKNEQQICAELGSPSAIALDLAETLGKKKKRSISTKIVQRMALTVALLVISLVYYFAVYQSANIVRDSILMLIGFTVVLWFALGGTLHRTPPVAYDSNKTLKWLLPTEHIILLLMAISIYLSFWVSESKLISDVNALPFVRIVINMRLAFVVIAILIAAFSVYGFFRFSPQYFTAISNAVGVVAYLSAVYNLMSRLDDLSTFRALWSANLVIYGASIILTALFYLFVRFVSRRAI